MVSLVQDEHNGYRSVCLPLAVEAPFLMQAILAAGSAHMSVRRSEYNTVALRKKSVALTVFRKAVISFPDHAVKLAFVLILLAIDFTNGDVMNWPLHLQGARMVIEAAGGPEQLVRKGGTRASFMLANFAYIDILATVTLRRKPLIEGPFWIDDPEPKKADTMMGVTQTLFPILSQIAVLDHEVLNGAISLSQAIAQGDIMQSQIMDWQPTVQCDISLLFAAEAYRFSILVCLFRCLRPIHPSDFSKEIAHAVNSILQCCSLVGPNTPGESSLSFPLFIAGGEVTNITDMGRTRSRLVQTYDNCSFKNINRVIDTLEETWKWRLQGRQSDWRDVLKHKNWALTLA